MDKFDILLEHLDLRCKFYDDECCKYYDGYNYTSCYGQIKQCEIKRIKENQE